MSKKTDRRNAILCLNKIKQSGKQSDIENFYFNHCPKFKPNKHSQKPINKYSVKIKAYVFSAPRDLNELAQLNPNDIKELARDGNFVEDITYNKIGKFKRTRYNNYKYKIVMA